MAIFQVQIAYTDGWRCETHRVTAQSVGEACRSAISRAGTAPQSWTSCEPGEALVDRVVEATGDHWIERGVPAAYREDAAFSRLMRQRDELANALRQFVENQEESGRARLVKKAKSLLRDIRL